MPKAKAKAKAKGKAKPGGTAKGTAKGKAKIELQSAAPVFLVSDVASTMRWYREKLGFEGGGFPKEPPHAFAVLRRDRVEIMLQAHPGHEKPDLYPTRKGGVWNAYIRLSGVRRLFEEICKDTEVTILEAPERQFYGDTEFVIQDPNGYVLVFSEAGSDPR